MSEISRAPITRTDPAADAAMDRYARGDDAAFAELYDRVAPRRLYLGVPNVSTPL